MQIIALKPQIIKLGHTVAPPACCKPALAGTTRHVTARS